MGKTALVAPVDGPLGAVIIDRLLRTNWSVVAGFAGDSFDGDTSDYEERCIVQTWKPSSFISARNLVLEATNRFGSIDSAIIVSEAESTVEALHETSAAIIEQHTSAWISGTMLLAREILSTLIKQQSGRLSIIRYAPEDRPSSILGNVTSASIAAFAESLLGVYGNERVAIDAFESKKSDIEGFAEFILSYEARSGAGKTHRFGSGRFPRLSFRGR